MFSNTVAGADFLVRSAASISGLPCPILKTKASISTETLVPTYKTRRRYNPEENNIQLFQVARGFSVSLYTVTASNLCPPHCHHYVWNGEVDEDTHHSSEYGY